MDGQLEAQIDSDDDCAAVQRLRHVVAVETYSPETLHESLGPFMQAIDEAKMGLGEPLTQREQPSIKINTEWS